MSAKSASKWLLVVLVVLVLGIEPSCGRGDTITPEEQALLLKLRPMVQNIIYRDFMNSDQYLVRFLRVRNFNVEAAKDMIQDVMTWRQANRMDTILLEDFDQFDKMYPFYFNGDSVDNDGRPIGLAHVGVVDFRRIVLSGQRTKFERYLDRFLELAESILNEMHVQSGRTNLTKSYIILDLSGFNLRQHACVQCIGIVTHIIQTYEAYYPDRFHRFYLVNTPRAFLPLFDLVKPLLSEPSKTAAKLFDHDKQGHQGDL